MAMTERITLKLWEPVQAHKAFAEAWRHAKALLMAGHRLVLEIRPETRSSEQNRLMWPLLTAFSAQLQWPVNGEMTYMPPDDWKDVLSAAFKKEKLRIAMGLDGGVVMLGKRTSKFTKAEFAEWIEFLYATASLRGVSLPEWKEGN